MMSKIVIDAGKFEKLISDLNSYSLSFKNHADQLNDLILKTDTCWVGSKANEYRTLANSFNTTEFENFYLLLSSFIERLSSMQTELTSVVEANRGD